MTEPALSKLRKTWIFDVDGTLVEHNGYKTGGDRLLPGVKEFFDSIPAEDFILLLTARDSEVRGQTIEFLNREGIRFDKIIFDVPVGERILINDDKPSGLPMSFSLRRVRNQGLSDLRVTFDDRF